jgi:hypothetical protein
MNSHRCFCSSRRRQSIAKKGWKNRSKRLCEWVGQPGISSECDNALVLRSYAAPGERTISTLRVLKPPEKRECTATQK